MGLLTKGINDWDSEGISGHTVLFFFGPIVLFSRKLRVRLRALADRKHRRYAPCRLSTNFRRNPGWTPQTWRMSKHCYQLNEWRFSCKSWAFALRQVRE